MTMSTDAIEIHYRNDTIVVNEHKRDITEPPIPQHLIDTIGSIAFGHNTNNNSNDTNDNNDNHKNEGNLTSDDDELGDDNIDDTLFSINVRPLLFVVISIIIIYIPVLLINNMESLYYIHLSYLLLNLVMFIILIPLYAKCVPESTDSIISNGGKLLNRRPPPFQLQITDKDDDNNNIENVSSCLILYNLDALYNRFFNIRNINYEQDIVNSMINFDSKIYNQIAISFAGIFLIISNIILLVCYSIIGYDSNDNNDDILSDMKNQITFLIFICCIIVGFSLFYNISVHFTQIKDDLRKTIENDIYVERLESNIQKMTNEKIFNNTFMYKLIYIFSIFLCILLWILYYKCYDNEIYRATANKNFILFIIILYSIILIHLIFRLFIKQYQYSIIIVKQFSKSIRVKTMHQVIIYWKLRNFYINICLYAFISLFHRILTFILILIIIILCSIYFMITNIDNIDIDIDKSSLLPIYILIVYILMFILNSIYNASNLYLLQRKHALMINKEIIFLKQFQYKNQYSIEMKSIMKTHDILSFINDIFKQILHCSPYKIFGISINETSEIIIRICFILFVINIFSYFL